MQGYADRVRRQATTRAALAFTVVGIAAGLAAGRLMQAGPGLVERAGTPQGGYQGLLLAVALLAALLAGVLLVRVRRGTVDATARDPVTTLYTRGYADEMVPRLMARDDRDGRSELALVLIGVDYLDEVRRRYGDRAVDEVMHLVGRQICGQARADDLPSRYDDVHLAVFLHCRETDQAVAFGRRLAMLLSGQQIDWHGDLIKVTVSMGVALRRTGESLEQLSGRAVAGLAVAAGRGPGQIESS